MGWLLLALWGLIYLALGPWTLVLTAVLLAVPRVRDRVPRPTFTRKGVAIGAGVLVAASAVVWAVPDGRLPIPHAGGLLVAPAYDGRQVSRDTDRGRAAPGPPVAGPDGLGRGQQRRLVQRRPARSGPAR